MPKLLDRPAAPDLYETDFFAWTEAQAAQLRARSMNTIDWDNLAEEIENVGRSEKREIDSRLEKLLSHLLKWSLQPDRRSHSWQSTISEQRMRIAKAIDYSPSLKGFPALVLEGAYRTGRRSAIQETGLSPTAFPESCPWSVEDVLSDDVMPGLPWSPDDLLRD